MSTLPDKACEQRELLGLLVEARKDLPLAAVGWNSQEPGDDDRTCADFHVPRVLDLMKRIDAAILKAGGAA